MNWIKRIFKTNDHCSSSEKLLKGKIKMESFSGFSRAYYTLIPDGQF